MERLNLARIGCNSLRIVPYAYFSFGALRFTKTLYNHLF